MNVQCGNRSVEDITNDMSLCWLKKMSKATDKEHITSDLKVVILRKVTFHVKINIVRGNYNFSRKIELKGLLV